MYALIVTLFAVLVLNGCERRQLEDEDMQTALIPVCIDWSESGVEVEKMHRASVWLFPANGRTPLEYRMEGNLSYREIAVPVGVYSVLVFNETIEENDWNGIAFTGTNRYETFAAVAVPEPVIGIYNRSDNLPLIVNPDAVAAWSLDRFEVSREMINRTRPLSQNKSALIAEAPHLTVVKPQPRFERVVVTAYVTNLSSSMKATGTMDGLASGVYMVSGKIISEPAVHALIFNKRVYDNNGYDGSTTCTFNVFGRLQPANHQLNIDFLLNDGTLHPREEFNVTNLIVTKTDEIVRTHTIKLGYSNLKGDHLMEHPVIESFGGISVDKWDEIIIPMQ
jgi:hypothetical protein